MGRLLNKLTLIRNTLRASTVTIACYGDRDARQIYDYFTSRHPKLPLFRRKTFGAALRAVPGNPEEVSMGSEFSQFRRKVRRSQKAGYRFDRLDPRTRIDDIMRVNCSSTSRQGGEMPGDYIDRELVSAEMDREGEWFGVFSRADRLEAYAFAPIFGDACVFWKILGNAALLDEGIVYQLLDGTMRAMAEKRGATGAPLWAMYDMYIGGGDGLREFKRRTGFKPMRVKWIWRTQG